MNQKKTIQDPDEDVHSKRFMESLKYQDEKIENLSNKYIKDQYKFMNEEPQNAQELDLKDLSYIEIENKETFHLTPQLFHNLDLVVKNPGFIYTMDEMSKLQEDQGQFLREIPQPQEVEMGNIPNYVPPSQDNLLLKFARESGIKYVMSTSTISNALCQMFYLFSGFRNPSFENISSDYDNEPKKFMISQRKPITNILRVIDKENKIYALDSDNGLYKFKNTILMNLGKVIEKQLTLDKNTFNSALRKTHLVEGAKSLLDEDHHRFMKLNSDICLRAQIDCRAKSQDGNDFVFEIKTRSACPIRYDLNNYQDYLDYVVKNRTGIHSSFEREYYDLIRGAMLKYSFQLKIGSMDGAFIAYHNTQQMFGFEYVKRTEIEKRIFGNSFYAEANFMICSKLLTKLIDLVLEDVKNQKFTKLKLGFYSCSHLKKMTVFAELMQDEIEWGKDSLIDQTEELKDEYDYFTKYKKFENQVYKYEFHIYPYINGVLQRYNNFELQPYDQISVKYKLIKLGSANFIDYMNFLHEAYKFESVNLDLSYIGAWLKN